MIYDPLLTMTLPAKIAGPSGMNAIAHCVEALYAQDANPITSLMAEEGIRALASSLPVVVSEPDNVDARAEALYGAWLAGASLGNVGMALHHKLCHTVGGSYNDAAQLATQNPYFNPRPIEYAAIRQLLQNAWEGKRPDQT